MWLPAYCPFFLCLFVPWCDSRNLYKCMVSITRSEAEVVFISCTQPPCPCFLFFFSPFPLPLPFQPLIHSQARSNVSAAWPSIGRFSLPYFSSHFFRLSQTVVKGIRAVSDFGHMNIRWLRWVTPRSLPGAPSLTYSYDIHTSELRGQYVAVYICQ